MPEEMYVPQPGAQFLRCSDQTVVSPNERDVLDLVRRTGVVSRSELTRSMALAIPSVIRLVDGLSQRGLLQLGPAVVKGRGQPSASVRLVPEFAYTFGVSILTDAYEVALIDFSGTVRAQQFVAFHPMQFDEVADQVQALMDKMRRKLRVDATRIFGVGVSMPAPFIGRGSQMNPPESMPSAWALVELDRIFAARWQYPVWLDNNANCAAIGESLHGVGRWASNFAYLHFAQGFGGGVVLNGKCFRGVHGNAGEFAAMLPSVGLERPTLESLRELLVAAGHPFDDVHTMLTNYDSRWPEIDVWIDRVQKGLSLIVAAIHAVLDLEAIVLGARLPRDLAERLLDRIDMKEPVRRGLHRPLPRLVIAEASSDAAVVGAAMLPFKECCFR